LLDDLRARASTRLASVQEKLRAQLNDSEAKLEALERSAQKGGFSGNLGAERTTSEQAEIKRFRESVARTRADLRASEREYRRGVDRVQGWVIFINVWLMPILIAGAGLFFSWRRTKAAGGG
jgi:Skp family chaperone for outer membrane proteins